MKRIRVLIVDNSASVRQTLAAVLSQDPDIEVMGVASDPFAAARRIHDEVPDVITLDVEMPRMDGITFLRKLMAQRPIPVVMCSSLTEEGSETLMQALEAGAVDVILKPRIGAADYLADSSIRICDAVKSAAQARVGGRRPRAEMDVRRDEPTKKLTADAMLPPPTGRAMAKTTEMVACIGASTGGTEVFARRARGFARQCARDRHRAAYAGEVHGRLCEAAQFALRGRSEGGRRRRSGFARTCADRARRQAHDARAAGCALLRLGEDGPARVASPSIGGCAVPLRRTFGGHQTPLVSS